MPDDNDLPQATVERRRRGRISVVWLIPILAAVVAIGIAVQRILSEGPTITIVLTLAQGVEAGKTVIKYKDVNIGQVTAVKLTPDYAKVEITAKMTKSASGLMVEDAKFWVVEPRITLSGVSGLGTLLSGNYIGFEAGKSTRTQHTFVGLAEPPIITSGQGKAFTLKAAKLGSLGVGAPVYYRSLEAGQVLAYDLSKDGREIDIKIFVNMPYDRYVNPSTRFWNASGIDVSVGATGVEVRTESLVALIAGGVAFDTPPSARASPAGRRQHGVHAPPRPHRRAEAARRRSRATTCCTSRKRSAGWPWARRSRCSACRPARSSTWAWTSIRRPRNCADARRSWSIPSASCGVSVRSRRPSGSSSRTTSRSGCCSSGG